MVFTVVCSINLVLPDQLVGCSCWREVHLIHVQILLRKIKGDAIKNKNAKHKDCEIWWPSLLIFQISVINLGITLNSQMRIYSLIGAQLSLVKCTVLSTLDNFYQMIKVNCIVLLHLKFTIISDLFLKFVWKNKE